MISNLFFTKILFVVLACGSCPVLSDRNENSSPSFGLLHLPVPRGGGNGSGSSGGNFGDLAKQFLQDAKAMDSPLQNYERVAQNMQFLIDQTKAMDQKTTETMKNLDMDLLRVSIQLNCLPRELSKNFKELFEEMTELKELAASMQFVLRSYISTVEECLGLLKHLVERIKQSQSSLRSYIKKEHRLSQVEIKKLQSKMRRNIAGLHQLTASTSDKVASLEKQAKENIWQDFLENAKIVQEKAHRIDAIFKTLRGENLPQHQVMPVDNFYYGNEPEEVEVEMTTYQFNSW